MKVSEHRARLRAQGLRPIQILGAGRARAVVPGEAHRQSLAVATSAEAGEDQAFIDAVSAVDFEEVRRGEIWTAAGGTGYAGKPRPVVIVQEDAFDATESITICAFTTDPTDAPLFRLPVEPNARNGLARRAG